MERTVSLRVETEAQPFQAVFILHRGGVDDDELRLVVRRNEESIAGFHGKQVVVHIGTKLGGYAGSGLVVVEHLAHRTHVLIDRSWAEHRVIQLRAEQFVHLIDDTVVGNGHVIVAIALLDDILLCDVEELKGIILYRRERAGHGLGQIGLHHIVQDAGEDRRVVVIDGIQMGIQVAGAQVQRRIAKVLDDVGSLLEEVILHGFVVRSQESCNLLIVVAGAALQRRVVIVPSRVEVEQLVVGHGHATQRLRQLGALRVLAQVADSKDGILTGCS